MTDEERAEAQRADLELRREIYKSDLVELTSSDAGLRFFAQLFAESNCLQSVHRQNAEVYRLSGVQAFGLKIWRDLHAANPKASLDIFDVLMSPIPTEEEQKHGA